MAADENVPLETYRGNCHCAAFVFEVRMPQIKDAMECNCSICRRKGYLFVSPGASGTLNIVKGDMDELTTYRFASGKIEHKFCPTCGTAVLATMPDGPPGQSTMLNAHVLQGLSSWDLEKKPWDGRALGDPYQTPKHHGGSPKSEVAGGSTYTGSCHCGAVTVAVASKPIDETFTGPITECNCSMCERGAYIWIYPLADEVVLSSAEEGDIGRYSFGHGIFSKTFCRKCGTLMTNEFKNMGDEQVAKLPETARKAMSLYGHHHPVNLRVMDAVDLSKLNVGRYSEGANNGPPYVNP